MRRLALLLIAACYQTPDSTCEQSLEMDVASHAALSRIEKRLVTFTIQPECAACPKVKDCPDVGAQLAAGDDALRKIDELRDAVRHWHDDPDYRMDDLMTKLEDLTKDDR